LASQQQMWGNLELYRTVAEKDSFVLRIKR